jgi:hypothetical protein
MVGHGSDWPATTNNENIRYIFDISDALKVIYQIAALSVGMK